jgi:hypothetical protein
MQVVNRAQPFFENLKAFERAASNQVDGNDTAHFIV